MSQPWKKTYELYPAKCKFLLHINGFYQDVLGEKQQRYLNTAGLPRKLCSLRHKLDLPLKWIFLLAPGHDASVMHLPVANAFLILVSLKYI